MQIRIIAGQLKGKRIQGGPDSDLLKPTTSLMREMLFNICQQEIAGSTFLDLFAGVGAVGLEAYSRGASTVYFVENNRKHAEIIHKNIALCQGEKECHLIIQDVFKALETFQKRGMRFDLIFADPPYGTKERSLSNQVLAIIDQGTLLKEGGKLFLEDHQEASDFETALTHLIPLKTRKVGKVLLREFSASDALT